MPGSAHLLGAISPKSCLQLVAQRSGGAFLDQAQVAFGVKSQSLHDSCFVHETGECSETLDSLGETDNFKILKSSLPESNSVAWFEPGQK